MSGNYRVEIVPSALKELKAIKRFYQRRIADAIDEQLKDQPTTPTRHRKLLQASEASFEFDPPLWEQRVADYRVFYDVDEGNKTVYVRAILVKPPHVTTEEVI